MYMYHVMLCALEIMHTIDALKADHAAWTFQVYCNCPLIFATIIN